MPNITADYSGLPDFNELASQLNDCSEPLGEFARYREAEFQSQIAGGVNPYGGGLAPLSAAYAARKSGGQIRVASGRTVGTNQTAVSGNQYRESIGGVAQYLQEGTSKMPARALLPLNGLPAKDQKALTDALKKWIEKLA